MKAKKMIFLFLVVFCAGLIVLVLYNVGTMPSGTNGPPEASSTLALAPSGPLGSPIGVKDGGSQYLFTLNIPGMEQGDVNVEVRGRELVVSAQKTAKSVENVPGTFYKKEQDFGSFSQSVTLPEDAGTDVKVQSFKNGVLTIAVPKKR